VLRIASMRADATSSVMGIGLRLIEICRRLIGIQRCSVSQLVLCLVRSSDCHSRVAQSERSPCMRHR
jgi:hypothetical protein